MVSVVVVVNQHQTSIAMCAATGQISIDSTLPEDRVTDVATADALYLACVHAFLAERLEKVEKSLKSYKQNVSLSECYLLF